MENLGIAQMSSLSGCLILVRGGCRKTVVILGIDHLLLLAMILSVSGALNALAPITVAKHVDSSRQHSKKATIVQVTFCCPHRSYSNSPLARLSMGHGFFVIMGGFHLFERGSMRTLPVLNFDPEIGRVIRLIQAHEPRTHFYRMTLTCLIWWP